MTPFGDVTTDPYVDYYNARIAPIVKTAIQGTWAWNEDDVTFEPGYLWNSTTADADEVQLASVSLRAGTYSLVIGYNLGPNKGKMDIKLDGVVQGATVDCYNAGNAASEATRTLTIAADGAHYLGFALNGKNAASSDYLLSITEIQLARTS